MKKLVSLVLALIMTFCLFSVAFADGDAKTVKMLVAVTGGKDEEEMELWGKALGELTGLNIVLEKPSDYNNSMLQKLSAGESYDLIYMNADQYMNLASHSLAGTLFFRISEASM